MIGFENGMYGQCAEAGSLFELALRQLGIEAKYRQLLATKDLATLEGIDNQIRYDSAATAGEDRGKPLVTAGNSLVLSYDAQYQSVDYNEINEGQGGVRVGDKYYTALALYVGEDAGSGATSRTAEHDALLQLEAVKQLPGGFQRYYDAVTKNWLVPADSEPVPGDPSA